MIDLSKVRNYYIACGYTDMRRGIDGLASIVIQQYGQELSESSLFLFCGRRTDRIKALYWCGDGYILLYERLNNGRFQWPRTKAELKTIDAQAFRWLMEGLKIEQPKAIKKPNKRTYFSDNHAVFLCFFEDLRYNKFKERWWRVWPKSRRKSAASRLKFRP